MLVAELSLPTKFHFLCLLKLLISYSNPIQARIQGVLGVRLQGNVSGKMCPAGNFSAQKDLPAFLKRIQGKENHIPREEFLIKPVTH